MLTLAPGRLALTASLVLALAGCAHHTTQYPPSDAFFNNPPPEGVLTPAKTGPGDRPQPKPTTAAPAAAAPAAAGGKKAAAGAAVPSATGAAATGAAVGAAATGSAAGAAAATGAAAAGAAVGGAAVGTAAAATAATVAKPSAGAQDTTQAKAVHVDELPVAVTRVPAQYPDAARAAGTQGTVQLEAFVKIDGTVGDVRVDVSVPGLDEAAKACVRQWTFKPGMSAGKPVEAWVGVPVSFRLH